MGQYYANVIGNEDGTFKVYSVDVKGSDGWNGMKLMEHSWWNNDLLCAVGSKLCHGKHRIAWVGDYANDEDFAELNENTSVPFTVEQVWKKRQSHHKLVKFLFPTVGKTLYLCNHDKSICLDLFEYYKRNCVNEWCINPISLLTAVGNGRGGGDYYDEYPDFNIVGSWVWDLLSIEKVKPEGYEDVMYSFKEEN